MCFEYMICIVNGSVHSLTIGTHNDSEGEAESNDLFIIVGREGTDAPYGKLGDGCHCLCLLISKS